MHGCFIIIVCGLCWMITILLPIVVGTVNGWFIAFVKVVMNILCAIVHVQILRITSIIIINVSCLLIESLAILIIHNIWIICIDAMIINELFATIVFIVILTFITICS